MALEIYWQRQQSRQLPEGGDAVDLELGLLVLDMVDRDQYDVGSDITDHSVGSVSQITDHQIPKNDRVMVTCWVSDSPTSATGADDAEQTSIDLPSGRSASVITMPEGTRRTDDAFDTLRRLTREGIPVDVYGLRRPVEGWMISDVSTSRSAGDSGALIVSISLRAFSVASTEETEAPSPRVERGRPRRDRGRQRAASTGDDETTIDPDAAGGWDSGSQSIQGAVIDYDTGEPLAAGEGTEGAGS